MKISKFIIVGGIIILFFLSASFVPSKEKNVQKKSEFDGQKLIEQWVEFWNAYDLNMMDQLFLTDSRLSYFSSEKQGLIKGFEAVVKHHQRFGFVKGGRKHTTKLWVKNIRGVNFGGTAVITAIWFFEKPDGLIQQGPMTLVCVKEEGKYKIAHMHFSKYSKDKPVKGVNPPYNIPPEVEAISLTGKLLYRTTPYKNTLINYQKYKKLYEENPQNPENIIWFGRWTAYKGNFREAIRIFTEGIEKFPDDARFYRHRGHRYISIRMFDLAIRDLEKAALLIKGTKDQVEPDGQPNALNIPVSTLHTNIYYHLGLAYYFKHDFKNALEAFQKGIKASANDDMLVAMIHWLYMSLRRMGEKEQAGKALEVIKPKMRVIENTSYYRLCLFYKGIISEDELKGEKFSAIMNDAVAYGLGNWYLYNNQPETARKIFEKILKGKIWASFGYIAAEADYKSLFLDKIGQAR